LAGVREAFRTRTRSAKRCLQQIHRLARRRGEALAEAQQVVYRRLCAVARQVVRQGERVQQALAEHPVSSPRAGRLGAGFARVLPLLAQGIDQAHRRVVQGACVPAAEKVVSLVEPHTAIIPRHKPGQPGAFGRQLWLAESDGGIISDYQVVAGAAPDTAQVAPSVARHRRQFGRAPRLLTGDRGCTSAAVRRAVAEAGVEQVALPQTGPPSTASAARERQGWFRRGYRWRAGIEGRIGVLKRDYGLDRCPEHGPDGMERWVGLGILTANLVTIARAVAGRSPR
jgi:IS5 family transposase